LAHQVQDDAFREIQLNGKQLVFLFMVVTVVSVVIFLCGVFVGRGVRAERAPLAADASASAPLTTPDVAPVETRVPAAAGSDPTVAAPPPAVDELSYFNRLEKSGQPARDSKPPGQKPAAPVKSPAPVVAESAPPVPAPAASPAPAPAPAARATAPPPEEPPASRTNPPAGATAASEPPGQGFALQVTALRERGEAEAIAKRLSSKGYAAYVLTPPNGTPSVYRVRVGKFKTRREAEAIATRLQKEEQFTPWITR
jgi:cell division septation protein DedD